MISARIVLVCLISTPLIPRSATAALPDELLPRPHELKVRDGHWRVEPARLHFQLRVPSAGGAAAMSRHLEEQLAGLDVPFNPQRLRSGTGENDSWIMAAGPSTDAPSAVESAPVVSRPQGYALTVTSEGVVVHAADEAGLFYGLQTFIQLLYRMIVRGDEGIPCMDIRDWPAIPMRGYSEDYGRNQLPTVEDHKRSIRNLASFKMNTYLWFIEPDHFVYQFDPTIGQDFDRFEFGEIRELVACAKRYHIDVIPTVELLGHMEMLLGHSKYRYLAEVEGGSDLCATCEDSFDLVRRLVGEIAPSFESKYFHCGLDESFAVGKGRSARALEERGLERIFADYYTRMNDLVKSHGKTMMMYADIVLRHPGIIDLLPKDIIMMFWQYDVSDRYEGFDRLHEAGLTTTALSALWDWRHMYPAYGLAFGNIAPMARQAAQLGAAGHFVSSWGDPVQGVAGTNLSELNTFGVAYTAAVSWNPNTISMAEFSHAFAIQFYGIGSPDFADALALLAECQDGFIWQATELFHADPVESIRALAGDAGEAMMAHYGKIRHAADTARPVLAASRPKRNADHLQSVTLAARMLQLAADMAFEFRTVAQGLGAAGFDSAGHAAQIESLAARHHRLWDDYRGAYLATNRPKNLVYIQRLWETQNARLMETAAGIRAGTFTLER